MKHPDCAKIIVFFTSYICLQGRLVYILTVLKYEVSKLFVHPQNAKRQGYESYVRSGGFITGPLFQIPFLIVLMCDPNMLNILGLNSCLCLQGRLS